MVWKVLTRESLEETKQEFASSGYVMQWYAMSMEIILTTLGSDWWKKNCLTNSIDPDEFLSLSDDSEDNRYRQQDRIIRLGHMLYALKDCHGYEPFISSLRTRDLSPAFFELVIANSLKNNNFLIEFVKTKGIKGEDYDLLAHLNGTPISVEVKTRRDGIILGENVLKNTLKKAQKQLPSSGPGIIFVSIPNEWTIERNAGEVIENCIDGFFRNTGRVNYTVLLWHQLINLEIGKASVSFIRQYNNPNPRNQIVLGKIIEPLQVPTSFQAEEPIFKPSFW